LLTPRRSIRPAYRAGAFALLVAGTAIVLSGAPADAASGGTNAQVRNVVRMTNQVRARAGCGPVTLSRSLSHAASQHSWDMANHHYFSHYTRGGAGPGTRVANAGYRWNAYGENIAWGQRDAWSVMNAWMNSPGHRHNILNCRYRNVGIGLAYNSRGVPYWTQDFGA
jgi:uncharacterized protein YkwD